MRVVTPPTAEPLSLADIRAYLRIASTADDHLLERVLLPAARERWERHTDRALLPQTIEVETPWRAADAFRRRILYLPRPPLRSIEAVTWYDDAGEETAIPSTAYRADTTHEPGRFVPTVVEDWPILGGVDYPERQAVHPRLRLRFEAGFDDADAVPAWAKLTLLRWVATFYEHREDIVVGDAVARLPPPLANLADVDAHGVRDVAT